MNTAIGHVMVAGAKEDPAAILLTLDPPADFLVYVMLVKVLICRAHPAPLFIGYDGFHAMRPSSTMI